MGPLIFSVVEFQFLKKFLDTFSVLLFIENIIYIRYMLQKNTAIFILGGKVNFDNRWHALSQDFWEGILFILPFLYSLWTNFALPLKNKHERFKRQKPGFLFLENLNFLKTRCFKLSSLHVFVQRSIYLSKPYILALPSNPFLQQSQ